MAALIIIAPAIGFLAPPTDLSEQAGIQKLLQGVEDYLEEGLGQRQ